MQDSTRDWMCSMDRMQCGPQQPADSGECLCWELSENKAGESCSIQLSNPIYYRVPATCTTIILTVLSPWWWGRWYRTELALLATVCLVTTGFWVGGTLVSERVISHTERIVIQDSHSSSSNCFTSFYPANTGCETGLHLGVYYRALCT